MAVDPLAALRSLLLADTAVAALVVDRVYGGEVPEAEAKNMPRACIVLNPAGGAGLIGRGNAEYGDSRIDTICHSSTLYESWKVYLAVYTALKHLEHHVSEHVLLHWAQPLVKGTLARDPETQWPTTLASWRVLASEIATP